jgi:acyl-CoA hydrolase
LTPPQNFAIVTAGVDRLQLVTHEQHVQQLRLGACANADGCNGNGAEPPAGSPCPAATAEADGAVSDGADWAAPPAPAALDEATRRELQRAVVEAPAGSDQACGGPLLIDNDLRLAGCVTWVGRSSLEVTIELADRPRAQMEGAAGAGGGEAPALGAEGTSGSRGGWRRRGVAHFILVARIDPAGGGAERAPQLVAATPEEEALLAEAAARQEERRVKRAAEADASAAQLAGAPPTIGPDALLLQQLVARAREQQAEKWQQQRRGGSGAGASGADGPQAVPMGTTALRTPVIMHHQDRNITNAVFGGHVSS